MAKIIARINKKTGELKLETQGFSGEACLEATRKLRDGLRMEAEPERTSEFYQDPTTISESQELGGG